MAKFWRLKTRRVLIDIDTQFDMLAQHPDWKRDRCVKNMRRLMAWGRHHKVNVISTVMSYRKNETNDQGQLRNVCIEGTPGIKKIPYTLLPSHIRFGPDKSTDLAEKLLNTYQQVIFEKRTADIFSLPRADRLLTNLDIDEFVVMGSQIETSICATVLGLISRRKPVYIIIDAISSIDKKSCKLALRKMEAKGAKLITTESLTGKRRKHKTLAKASVASR